MSSLSRNNSMRWTRWSVKKNATDRSRQSKRRVAPTVLALETRVVPTTFLVNSLGNDGPGTLRQAITDANAKPGADLIAFGQRLQNRTIQLSEQIRITGDLTIDGGDRNVTISGNDKTRIFLIAGDPDSVQEVSIKNLTFTRGKALDGGAILNRENLTITGSTFLRNHADHEGGAIENAGVLNLVSTRISRNSAADLGGGIWNTRDAFLSSQSSTLSDNGARSGGAILNDGKLTMFSSLVENNHANAQRNTGGLGGGIYSDDALAVVSIYQSTFARNHADSRGGGIKNTSGVLQVVESTMFGNSADGAGNKNLGDGGAIDTRGGSLEVLQSTIAGNVARDGGGIFRLASATTLANSILADNKDQDGKGDFGGNRNNVKLEGVNWVEDGAFGNDGKTIFSGDPKLSNRLANNGGPTPTVAPQSNSPVINIGDNLFIPVDPRTGSAFTVDQRGAGFARIVKGIVDLGALEVQAPPQS